MGQQIVLVLSVLFDLTKTLNRNRRIFAYVFLHTCYMNAWADECLCADWTYVAEHAECSLSGQRMNVFLIRVFLLEVSQMTY